MASTNKTANYNLSQYVGTDKPTYLSDYNTDMYNIDAQMKVNADNIATAISGIETATTTANTANTNAQTAISTANSASTTAGEASTTATNAQSTANSALATATTAQTTADSANTAVSALASEVNTKLSWTLLGDATGTTPITLPSDFNELMIHFDQVGTSKSYVYMFEKTMLTTTPVDYVQGGYISASNCSQVALEITTTDVKIAYAYQNGANDTTSSAVITVFYR